MKTITEKIQELISLRTKDFTWESIEKDLNDKIFDKHLIDIEKAESSQEVFKANLETIITCVGLIYRYHRINQTHKEVIKDFWKNREYHDYHTRISLERCPKVWEDEDNIKEYKKDKEYIYSNINKENFEDKKNHILGFAENPLGILKGEFYWTSQHNDHYAEKYNLVFNEYLDSELSQFTENPRKPDYSDLMFGIFGDNSNNT